MKLKLYIALVLLPLTLTPTLALAKTRTGSAHMRPQLFHDRAPKAHIHSSRPHLGK